MTEQADQYTPVRMLPVDESKAVWLAENAASDAADPFKRDCLIELLCGIAAIENDMFRQETAFQAILAVYQLGNEYQAELARYVEEKIYGAASASHEASVKGSDG